MKALLVDVDDTLFDWLAMWHAAFGAGLELLRTESSLEQDSLLDALRATHVDAGTSERGYHLDDSELFGVSLDGLQRAIRAFENQGAVHTVLFEGVHDTLKQLKSQDVLMM